MTWDMFMVTVALVMVLLFVIILALLSRIWEDQSPRPKFGDRKTSSAEGSPAVEIKKAVGREESLAS